MQEKIIQLFRDRLNVEVPGPEVDLIQAGLLDSLALVELILQLEREFGVTVELDDVDLDHFRTVRAVASYVAQRTAAASPPG